MSHNTMNREFHEAQIAKIYEDIERSRVETEKMRVEITKIAKESKYFVVSMLLGSAVLGALVALGSVFISKLYL